MADGVSAGDAGQGLGASEGGYGVGGGFDFGAMVSAILGLDKAKNAIDDATNSLTTGKQMSGATVGAGLKAGFGMFGPLGLGMLALDAVANTIGAITGQPGEANFDAAAGAPDSGGVAAGAKPADVAATATAATPAAPAAVTPAAPAPKTSEPAASAAAGIGAVTAAQALSRRASAAAAPSRSTVLTSGQGLLGDPATARRGLFGI